MKTGVYKLGLVWNQKVLLEAGRYFIICAVTEGLVTVLEKKEPTHYVDAVDSIL